MTEEARKEALRELGRLAKMSPAAADYHVTRTYLEWLVALPWKSAIRGWILPKRSRFWMKTTGI